MYRFQQQVNSASERGYLVEIYVNFFLLVFPRVAGLQLTTLSLLSGIVVGLPLYVTLFFSLLC